MNWHSMAIKQCFTCQVATQNFCGHDISFICNNRLLPRIRTIGYDKSKFKQEGLDQLPMKVHFLYETHLFNWFLATKNYHPRKLSAFEHVTRKMDLTLSTFGKFLLLLAPIWTVQINIACLVVSHSKRDNLNSFCYFQSLFLVQFVCLDNQVNIIYLRSIIDIIIHIFTN